MALTRVDSTVGLQPGGGYTQVNLGVASAQQEARSWGEAAQAAQTGFDLIKREHDEDAIRQAQTDAPQAITRDGKGMLVPVSDFSAPGGYLQSKAYKDAYRNQYFNTYSTSVEQDHSNFLTGVRGRHPTDMVAAQKEMDERRDATVANLDPRYAPLITLKLNAMNGQAISQINGNAQQERIKVLETQAEYSYQDVIAQAGRFGQAPKKWDEETLRLNHGLLVEGFRKADELMTSAGYTPERKAQKWTEARFAAQIAEVESNIRQTVLNKDQLKPGQFEAWLLESRANIVHQATTMGADGPAFLQRASAALGWASQTGQLQIQQQDQTVLAQQQTDQLRRAQQRASPGRSMIPEDLLQIEQNDRLAVFTNSNLTSAQKVRGIAMIDQSVGQVKGDLVEFANNNITSLVNRAKHIDTPNGQIPGILNELKNYVSDPRIASWLPTASKNYAENQLATIATDSAKTDIATTAAMMKAGMIPPDKALEWKKNNPNYFGDHKLITDHAWAQMYIEGDAAYRKRQSDTAGLTQVLDNWQKGNRPPSAADEALLAGNSATAFNNGGRGPWDINDPDHRDNAAAYFQQTGVIAAPAKAAMKDMEFGTDAKYAASYVGMYKSLKAVAQNKFGGDEEMAIAFLNKGLGDQTVEYLATASRTSNPEEAFRRLAARKTSMSGNAGGNQSMVADALEQPFQEVLAQLGPGAGEHPTLGTSLSSGSTLDPEDYWTRGVLKGDAPTPFGQVIHGLNSVLPFPGTGTSPHSGTYAKISATDDVAKEIKFLANTKMQDSGQLDNVSHPNTNFRRIALKQAMLEMRDNLEMVADPKDPTRGVLQWKSASTKFSESMGGRPVSEDYMAGIASGLHQHLVELDAALGVKRQYSPDIDWKKLTAVRVRSSDGSFSVNIMAPNRHSVGIETLHRIPDSSPIFGAFFGDITQQASNDLRNLYHGPANGIDEKAEGWFGARAAAAVMDASRFVARAAMSPFMGAERNAVVGDYLQRMSDTATGKDSRPPIDRWFNNTVGKGPYTPTSIDWEKTRKVLSTTKDEALLERAKTNEYLSRLSERNRIALTPAQVPK